MTVHNSRPGSDIPDVIGSDMRAARAKIEAAKDALLSRVAHIPVPSAGLIYSIEADHPELDRDSVRFAYWALVGEGRLTRTGTGVVQREEAHRAGR